MVLYSGGLDSVLVLHLMREFADVPVVIFAEDFTRDQWKQVESMVLNWGLTLYTFPPANRYFVPNKQGLSLVDEYGLGVTIPVVRDFEHSDSVCGLELSKERCSGFSLGWDTIFTGIRKFDRHYSLGRTPVKNAVDKFGEVTFVSPLYDWTRKEVTDAVKHFGLPVIGNTGEIEACHSCLKDTDEPVFCHIEQAMIPTFQWNRDGMRSAFRDKYIGA